MIKSADLGKEIAVTIVNKIGVLADISRLLSETGINIEAVAGYAIDKDAKIMLVTDDNLRSVDALKKAGYGSLKENEVIILELENEPGALKTISTILADNGIDIKQICGTTCTCGCPTKIILSTSNNEKALLAFKK